MLPLCSPCLGEKMDAEFGVSSGTCPRSDTTDVDERSCILSVRGGNRGVPALRAAAKPAADFLTYAPRPDADAALRAEVFDPRSDRPARARFRPQLPRDGRVQRRPARLLLPGAQPLPGLRRFETVLAHHQRRQKPFQTPAALLQRSSRDAGVL